MRLRRMLKTGVVSAGDRIEYSIKAQGSTLLFFAELAADGSIVKPHEVLKDGPIALPDALHDSPTAFANAMYTRSHGRLQTNKRRPCINGWTDCKVNGKTLSDLRYSMYLREHKHSANSSPTASIPTDSDVVMRDAQPSPANRIDDATASFTRKATSPVKSEVDKPASAKKENPKKSSSDASVNATESRNDEEKEQPLSNQHKSVVDLGKKTPNVPVDDPGTTEQVEDEKRKIVATPKPDNRKEEVPLPKEASEIETNSERDIKDGTDNSKTSTRIDGTKRTDIDGKSTQPGKISETNESTARAETHQKLATALITKEQKHSEISEKISRLSRTDHRDRNDDPKSFVRENRDIRKLPNTGIRSASQKNIDASIRNASKEHRDDNSRPERSGDSLKRKRDDNTAVRKSDVDMLGVTRGNITDAENKRSDHLLTAATEHGVSKDRAPRSEKKDRSDDPHHVNRTERKDRSSRKDNQANPRMNGNDQSDLNEEVAKVSSDVEPQAKRSKSPDFINSDKASDDASDDNMKKKKSKPQKRKRSGTPQSDEADADRSSRVKSRRRFLDPASAEAAAVAAAAEKQEAIAARRTTRLASGKITKVVYSAPSKPTSGDHDSDGEETARQPRKKDKPSKRNPKRRAKVETEGSDSVSGEEETEDEAEERKVAIRLLTQVALAIQQTKSITLKTIIGSISEKSTSTSEARDLFDRMHSHLRSANSSVGYDAADDVLMTQCLGYLAAEIGRWNIGKNRPASLLDKRRHRLEKKRSSAEKSKRRSKRDYDESVTKLEHEMEGRRRAELEAAHMTINLQELQRNLDHETEAKAALAKEVRFIKLQEFAGRKRVEKAKRLFGQLVEAAKDNDAPRPTETAMDVEVPIHNGAGSSSKKRGPESGSICESITSDDERDAALPRAPQTGSTPMDPARAAEVERLRSLVRTRGAESEERQRLCEMEHIRLRVLLEQKDKLDTQIYRKKNKMPNLAKFLAYHASTAASRHEVAIASAATGGGNTSATHAARNKESGRKDKGGSSKHANGNGKSKSSGKNGGHSGNRGSKKSSKKEDKSKRKSSAAAAAPSS